MSFDSELSALLALAEGPPDDLEKALEKARKEASSPELRQAAELALLAFRLGRRSPAAGRAPSPAPAAPSSSTLEPRPAQRATGPTTEAPRSEAAPAELARPLDERPHDRVPRLQALLAGERRPEVLTPALEALAEECATLPAEQLQFIAGHPNVTIRLKLLEVCHRGGASREHVALCLKFLKDPSASVRSRAMGILAAYAGPGAVEAALGATSASSEGGLPTFSPLPGPTSAPESALSPKERIALLENVRARPDPDMAEAVLEMIDPCQPPEVLVAACRALSALPPPTGGWNVEPLLSHRSSAVRSAALLQMACLPDPDHRLQARARRLLDSDASLGVKAAALLVLRDDTALIADHLARWEARRREARAAAYLRRGLEALQQKEGHRIEPLDPPSKPKFTEARLRWAAILLVTAITGGGLLYILSLLTP